MTRPHPDVHAGRHRSARRSWTRAPILQAADRPARRLFPLCAARRLCRKSRRETQVLNGGQTLKPLSHRLLDGRIPRVELPVPLPENVARASSRCQGVYSTRDFFGSELGGGIYFNSPVDYLAGLDDQHVLDAVGANRLIFCCGQRPMGGADARRYAPAGRGAYCTDIPAWVDYWGSDVGHDWPWWHKQLKYFARVTGWTTTPRIRRG